MNHQNQTLRRSKKTNDVQDNKNKNNKNNKNNKKGKTKQKGGFDISSNPLIYSATTSAEKCVQPDPLLNVQTSYTGTPSIPGGNLSSSGFGDNVLSKMSMPNLNLSNYKTPYSANETMPDHVSFPTYTPSLNMASGSQYGGAGSKRLQDKLNGELQVLDAILFSIENMKMNVNVLSKKSLMNIKNNVNSVKRKMKNQNNQNNQKTNDKLSQEAHNIIINFIGNVIPSIIKEMK